MHTHHAKILPGVSYFVYNENIDIYSGKDPVQQEFMEAGLEYLESLITLAVALPVYRLYKNKTYRDYERIIRRLQKAGNEVFILQLILVLNIVDQNVGMSLVCNGGIHKGVAIMHHSHIVQGWYPTPHLSGG